MCFDLLEYVPRLATSQFLEQQNETLRTKINNDSPAFELKKHTQKTNLFRYCC